VEAIKKILSERILNTEKKIPVADTTEILLFINFIYLTIIEYENPVTAILSLFIGKIEDKYISKFNSSAQLAT